MTIAAGNGNLLYRISVSYQVSAGICGAHIDGGWAICAIGERDDVAITKAVAINSGCEIALVDEIEFRVMFKLQVAPLVG